MDSSRINCLMNFFKFGCLCYYQNIDISIAEQKPHSSNQNLRYSNNPKKMSEEKRVLRAGYEQSIIKEIQYLEIIKAKYSENSGKSKFS